MTVLAYRNSQPESRDFWKQELTQAVSEIRQMYDDKLEVMRGQMESNCNVKVTKALYHVHVPRVDHFRPQNLPFSWGIGAPV